MTALAPTLQAFFTERLIRQRQASPDHAPRGAFLHLRRGGARHRSDRLIGANPLTVQRVWG